MVLTFQVSREPLALDIRHVREVVPRVRLQAVSGAPDWLAGVFVYRVQIVPVLDLHRLVGGGECPPHLSSRIILVPHRCPDGGERLLELLATQVADIREVQNPGLTTSLTADGRADLGPVVADGLGVLRLLALDRLLPDSAWRQLLTRTASGSTPTASRYAPWRSTSATPRRGCATCCATFCARRTAATTTTPPPCRWTAAILVLLTLAH